jgi:acyl carrier protein
MTMSTEEVYELLVERLAAVLGVDPAEIDASSRFDEDLHADSLDLVEVVEAVERTLDGRGLAVSVADEELASFTTVGQAAELIAGQTLRG